MQPCLIIITKSFIEHSPFKLEYLLFKFPWIPCLALCFAFHEENGSCRWCAFHLQRNITMIESLQRCYQRCMVNAQEFAYHCLSVLTSNAISEQHIYFTTLCGWPIDFYSEYERFCSSMRSNFSQLYIWQIVAADETHSFYHTCSSWTLYRAVFYLFFHVPHCYDLVMCRFRESSTSWMATTFWSARKLNAWRYTTCLLIWIL